VLCACAAAVVAVISYTMGDWPWNFHWFDGNKPDSLLLAVAEESRSHIAGIGMIGVFATSWLLLRKRNLFNSSDDSIEPVKSELIDLDAENQRLKEEIENAEAARSAFLSTISHELRTPMNGIIGMTELLQASNLGPRESGYVNTIHSSANSLMHSLSDILDFTRLSTGKFTLEHARFNLPDCVEDVCEMLADAAHQRGNELVCQIDPSVPVMVDGDHSRIRQILNHLVGNAIAFTSDGEVIVRLSLLASKDRTHTLQCDVTDTGEGIPPETQIQLFDAFSQVDSSRCCTAQKCCLWMTMTPTELS